MDRHKTLLEMAHDAGLEVRLEGFCVVVDGPPEAEDVALLLINNPKQVALEMELEAYAHLEERAAIIEFEGGLSRDQAQIEALNIVGVKYAEWFGTTPGTVAFLLSMRMHAGRAA